MSDVDLSFDEIDYLINEVSLGGKFVNVPDKYGDGIGLFLLHCVGREKLLAQREYNIAYEKALDDGFLTMEETRDIYERQKNNYGDLENEIKALEARIDGQEKYLSKLTRVPARRAQAVENINKQKEKLRELHLKKEEGMEYTAERVAQEQKYLYMTMICARYPDTMERFWPTKECFRDEKDLVLRRNIFIEVVKMSAGMEPEIVRYIARSNIWRIRYLTSLKTGVSLFDVPLNDYSVDQLSLSYWSHYYQGIYDMMPEDRPSDDIIEDDAALDAFMKSYEEEKSREATAAREGKKSGPKSAWDHNETLVMRSNEAYEDIEYSDTIESLRNKNASNIKVKKS